MPRKLNLINLLLTAIERFREADENHQQESEEKKSKIEVNTKKAIEMRKRSLETFGETKERNGEEVKCKRARNSGSETIQYLREKSENELKLREEELQQRKTEHKQKQKQHDLLLQMMLMQQQQQFQAQQQQQTALLAVLAKFANK